MTEARGRAPAKLNLFLEVLGRRADGYHDLATVMATLDWADELSARAAGDGALSLRCAMASDLAGEEPPPEDDRNLVLRAARAWREAGRGGTGASFDLVKHVPAGAGLGGGSSDAALALRLMDALAGRAADPDGLAAPAAATGADVAFFLRGGLALCEGRGERITPLAPTARRVAGTVVTVFVPTWAIATPAAYRALAGGPVGDRPVAPFLDALATGDPEVWAPLAFNRFERPVFALEPRARAFADALERLGVRGARLSGSGGAFWAVGDHTALATALRQAGARLVRRARLCPETMDSGGEGGTA